MKYLYPLLWLFVFLSCNDVLPDAEETEGEIEIFPDYKEVAVDYYADYDEEPEEDLEKEQEMEYQQYHRFGFGGMTTGGM